SCTANDAPVSTRRVPKLFSTFCTVRMAGKPAHCATARTARPRDTLTSAPMRAAMATAMVAAALPAICAAPARADDETETRARGHYEIGQGLYRLGDYRAAIKEFAAGYELSHKPGFLVNLGQSYRKLGELGHAREMYQKFLATVPAGDPKRAQVESV